MKQSWTARYGGKCLLDSWADMTSPRFGGPWTERKLQILQAYLDSYTTALKNQPFALTYVDGFAGAGSYRESGADYDEFDEFRQGSTRIALAIDDKPFDRFVFIEKEVGAAEALLTLASEFQGRQIEVVQGDANIGVPQFCHNMSDFDRAVVFLDPYATEVSWETVKAIAESGKIDCWILFPLMAVTRLMPTQKNLTRHGQNDWIAYSASVITGNKATMILLSFHSLKATRDDNVQRGLNRLRIDIGSACAPFSTALLQLGAH